MRRRSLSVLVAALAALSALAVAATAALADGVAVRAVDASRLPLVRVVVASPSANDATPRFAITENGHSVSALTVDRPTGGAAIALVIDASRSMTGKPITAALGAAAQFAKARGGSDKIAVVSFSDTVQVTSSLSDVGTVIDRGIANVGIGAKDGTDIWGGLLAAIDATSTGDAGERRVIVLLTDGANDASSKSTIADVIAKAKQENVAIHAIGLGGQGLDSASLQQLTSSTGGSYREASGPAELATLYSDVQREIASTYYLGYRTEQSGRVSLTVSNGTSKATTIYDGGAAAVVPGGSSGSLLPASVTKASWAPAALAGIVGLLVLLAGLALFPRKPRVDLAQRLRAYDVRVRVQQAASTADRARSSTHAITAATDRVLGRLQVWRSLGDMIDRADVPLRTGELFYVMLGSAFVAVVPTVAMGLVPPLRIVAMVVGFFLPVLVVRQKARAREKAFDAQLPDVLVAMAASLKAGHSFNQALEAIIRDGNEPASTEFGRAAQEIRLGRPADEALEMMAQRLNSKNFEFVVLCVNIQRQVGGSLAELLDTVAETVRERHKFLRKVKALVAMGKMSAYTLTALPFLMGLAISAINPHYMGPLFSTGTGRLMMGTAAVLVSIGTVVLRKMVNQKVD